jgi:hypothetical protein
MLNEPLKLSGTRGIRAKYRDLVTDSINRAVATRAFVRDLENNFIS